MSNGCSETNLNPCGCCATDPPLAEPQNRPGLPALSYRLGTYAVFFEQLLDGISGAALPDGPNQGGRPLAALTTRSLDDASIALLDAWSTVADVLTFYQERIANEGYLRTATERLSILQLAREIGYELAPGVAATAYLAFTVEEIIGVAPSTGALSATGPGNSPYNSGVVDIPQGSQVQSVPAPNALPQTFETSEDFEAHVEWNNLQPRLTRPPDIAMYLGSFYLLAIGASFPSNTQGLFTLPTGQLYPLNATTILPSTPTVQAVLMQELFLQGVSTNLKYGDRLLLVGENQGQLETELYTVRAVEADATLNQTCVTFVDNPTLPPFQPDPVPSTPLPSGTIPFTAANVNTYILQNTVRESDLQAFLKTSGWDAADLMAQVNNPPAPANPENGVFAMRSVAAFYGNNAPLWKSLTNPGTVLRADPYPIDWDAPNHGKGRTIWTDSQGDAHHDADVLLERSFPQVLPESWAYFSSPQQSGSFRITDAADQSVADYGMSAKATGLTLDLPSIDRPLIMGTPSVASWDKNRMDLFAIGSDQNLYHWVWDGAWQAHENLGGGNLFNAPSAVSWGPGRIDVFAVGEDGNLYHWPNNSGASGLQNLGGGYLMNSPSAVSWGPGRIDVFAVGFDGALYHFWNANLNSTQQWNGPEYRGGNNLVNSPKAISQAADTLEIFTNGSDGHAYSHQWANHKWTGPDKIGAASQSEKFVNSPARGPDVQIYNIATDGKLYLFLYQSSAIWEPWYGQNLTGSPATTSAGNGQFIFAVGANGDLQQVITGTGQRDLGGNASLTGSPALANRGGDLIDILVSNASGHMIHFSFDGKVWAPPVDLGGPSVPPFLVRKTTAYVQSELQPLAGLPITDDIPAGTGSLMLNNLTIGLAPGGRVALSGMRSDAPGVVANEILTLNDVVHAGGLTILEFAGSLAYSYQRDSVSINANVVKATHGATVQEVLGNGDASQPNQSFTLKRPPLTYVPATTPSGAASTLQIQVNNLNWTESPTLYGLGAKSEDYIVRLADDGTPTITFGDPAARLKTGQQNIRATYRTGIGSAGNVDAASLSILMTRPPGTRGVVNPLPASGGADPQNLSDARVNAPLTVLTLDRIVSLDDYENFCQAFAGVGKAQAVEIWSGQNRLVHITIAAANGEPVDPIWPLYGTLISAIEAAHDPVQQFLLGGFQPRVFNLTASILVNPRHQASDVLAAVTAALQDAFSFSNRTFAQAVTAAEIMTMIQSVPGVVATDLTQLYFTGDPNGPKQTEPPPYLPSFPARWEFGFLLPAQLLLINPLGAALTEMQP